VECQKRAARRKPGGRVLHRNGGAQRRRLAFAVQEHIRWLLETRTHVAIFVTFTFQENVTDFPEAQRRWRRLKMRLCRTREGQEGMRGVGVWQRQKRGAWHLHYVFDRWLHVEEVREACLATGFGPFCNMRIVQEQGGHGIWSHAKVAGYVTRYVARHLDATDKGLRLVDYMGRRYATTSFRWLGGFSRLYRSGAEAFQVIYGRQWNFLKDKWDFLIRLGWEWMNSAQRNWVTLESDSVARWIGAVEEPF
jgi:hypothetical protein